MKHPFKRISIKWLTGNADVFNRYCDAGHQATVHILKHVFPRQFGLHNVFTSQAESTQSARSSRDYTLREDEILGKPLKSALEKRRALPICRMPKRLRTGAVSLMTRTLKLHNQASYPALVHKHCPQRSLKDAEPGSFVTLATDPECVAAFCQAAISSTFAREWLGSGDKGARNWSVLSKNVARFVHARRYETFWLEDFLHTIQVSSLDAAS